MLTSRRQALRLLASASALTGLASLPGWARSRTRFLGEPDAITPFRVAIPEAALTDLRKRLAATRWPERETVRDWSQGVPLAKAQTLIAYWRHHYDWRRLERRLNSFPQFRTVVDGLGIHFLHVRSQHPDALPLLLTHGWPGSIIEFLDVIGPLTDPMRHGGRCLSRRHSLAARLWLF